MGFNSPFNSSGGSQILTDIEVDGTSITVDVATNKVGIGTSTPDNKLTVVGGHVSSDGGFKTGTQYFSWSGRTASFGAGTDDLVSYLNFGNNSVWGWVEVTLTDAHSGAQTTGKYTKRYQIGRNIDQASPGHQSSEVPASLGSVAVEWNLGAFEVDSSVLRIPIHRVTTNVNNVTVFVEGQLHVAALDTVDNVLNSLSLSTPAVVTNSETRDYYSVMSTRMGVGVTAPVTRLTVDGTITLKEQPEADADTAGYGKIWVDTATPNKLYFTDDAGTDTQLGAGGGADANDLDHILHQQVFS